VNARPLLVLAACAALAAWVSAQPGGPSAGESLQILEQNRELYEDMTRSGLALADRNTPLDRADECQRMVARLGREVEDAARRGKEDRLAEVSDRLQTVAADGLAPNLAEARRNVTPKSPEYKRLQEVHQLAFDRLKQTADAIPTDGDLGTSAKAQNARQQLASVRDRIGPPPEAK
jgi:hypothetical protein